MNGPVRLLDWPPERPALLWMWCASNRCRWTSSEVNLLKTQKYKKNPEGVDHKPVGFWVGIRQIRTIGWTSVLFALLQSLCTAVLTISGIRVAIGLSALAAASGVYAPARGFYQDGSGIPMLV